MKVTHNIDEIEAIFQGCKAFWTEKAKQHGAINWPNDQFENAELNKATARDMLRGYPEEELSKAVVFDFGCGEGRLIPYIAPKVYQYIGVDASASCIEYAKIVASNFHNASVHELAHASVIEAFCYSGVDLFVSWTVFQHIPHALTNYFFGRISSRLRAGARANIQFDWPPLHEAHKRDVRWRFDQMADNDCRCRWWPEWLLWNMLTSNGFDICELPKDTNNQCWRMVKK